MVHKSRGKFDSKKQREQHVDTGCCNWNLEFNSKILIIFEYKTALPGGIRQKSKNKIRGKIIRKYDLFIKKHFNFYSIW